MAYGVAGLGRFHGDVFQQRGKLAMVLRVISTKTRTTEQLNLPSVISRICEEQRGLVLVTGTTGSGKSTTLAAMIDRINANRADHLITIEDPIEFLHRDKKSFINQREVEVDTANFSTALRAALRQDPDVILVGEMRDLETISTALLAAETGHLVLSTLHTLDATETIQRIIAVFPPPEQKQIRLQLAATLKAVVSQRLVRRADDKGRVPACEIMIATGYIRDCIINADKTRLIHDAIAAGTSQYGMQTFDQSLFVDGDELLGVEIEERLIEGLHAVLAGAGGDGVVNQARFVRIDDAVTNVRGGDHDFDRGNAAFVVGAAHQALGNDGLQRGGELQTNLLLLGRRKDRDNTLNGFGGVESVQGGEHKVAGFGGEQSGRNGFEVAHFADENHVRVLTKSGAQGGGEVGGVDFDFALIDEAFFIAVQELDGVFDGDDVVGAGGVEAVDDACESIGLTGTGGSGDEHEAALLFANFVDDRRKI